MHLQRLKLFKKLEIEPSNIHQREPCCETPLDETELDCLDQCFEMSSKLSDSEKSTLYYIGGYITHKEGLTSSEIDILSYVKASEFTKMVSRGKLCHPLGDLYDLSQYLFAYYKNTPEKSCANRLIKAFTEISEVAFFAFEKSVFRRFVNSFSKGFAVQCTDKIKRQKKN